MRGIHRFLFAMLLLAGVLGGTRTCGQGGATGAISGVVADTGGGSVAGADVQILIPAPKLWRASLQPHRMAPSSPRCCRRARTTWS